MNTAAKAGVVSHKYEMNREAMRVERSISTGPRRSTEQTCVGIGQLIETILRDRAYPDTGSVTDPFAKLFPLLRYLLSTRKIGEPAITVAMPDLQVDIVVSYNPQFEEDLTVPNTMLLDRLSSADSIRIDVHSTEDVASPLRDLPESASSGNVRFALRNQPVHDDPVPPDADDTLFDDPAADARPPGPAIPDPAIPGDPAHGIDSPDSDPFRDDSTPQPHGETPDHHDAEDGLPVIPDHRLDEDSFPPGLD